MQTRAISLDPIESRRVKDARLEHVLHEPLAFDATMAGLRPWPWGWASDHEGRDHHRSAAAQLHLVANFDFHARHPSCPEFYIGHETYAAKLAKGSVLLTGTAGTLSTDWDVQALAGAF